MNNESGTENTSQALYIDEARAVTMTDAQILASLDAKIQKVNEELESNTVQLDKSAYILSVASGLICGCLDSFFFRNIELQENGLYLVSPVSIFKQNGINKKGLGLLGDKYAHKLEDAANFVMSNDLLKKTVPGILGGITNSIMDLAHYPTPQGLVCSVFAQMLKVCSLKSENGKMVFTLVNKNTVDIVMVFTAALITGVMNWLLHISTFNYEEDNGTEVPESIYKLAHIISTTPIIKEIIDTANSFAANLSKGMGSIQRNHGKEGTGGVFLSLFSAIAVMPSIKNTGLPKKVTELKDKYLKGIRIDNPIVGLFTKQAMPVLVNEILTRTLYMLIRFRQEFEQHDELVGINWSNVIPLGNRSVDRMLTVSALTFNFADAADAAVRAALESGGQFVVFAGRFCARYNYIGAGRAVVALVKEYSYEVKDAQLVHERMLLMGEKADIMLRKLEEFKQQLEEKLTNYLTEDITAFLKGFDDIRAGLMSKDSDQVIRGNNTIQKALGREAQFSSQKEFDHLMNDDDISLQL